MTWKCRVKAHVLRDYWLKGWDETIVGRWHYRDLAADENWRNGWISFDSVTWNPDDSLLYCGLNSLDGDLLYTFDPRTGGFASLGTRAWTDDLDCKIHRTILRDPRTGCIYFGTSLLHDADMQERAAGGKLVRYDPRKRSFTVLGIPFPHLYLQSIAADFDRSLLYAFTYPAEFVVRHDMESGSNRTLGYVGNALMFSQPHNAVVDKYGRLWGTYAETRAWDEVMGAHPIRLFAYDPGRSEFRWFPTGLSRKADPAQLLPDPPKPEGIGFAAGETRHKEDYGFCDSMLYDGDRYIYAGTVAGVLCRIDIETCAVEKICHVIAAGRLPALALSADGVLYGAGGMQGHTQLFRWDTRGKTMESLASLFDPELGQSPARVHEMAVDGHGTLYLAENDNHYRSSYLWTVTPE